MLWVPPAKLVLLNEANPPLNIADPICVERSRNEIEPVGTPLPDWAVTPALKVTLCPLVTCVADAESEVAVPIFAGAVITTEIAFDVEAAKFGSPE